MEPKLKQIWDSLLDNLENNTLSRLYLTDQIEPYFNYLIFKSKDESRNNLLNYALIYKNTMLLEFIVSRINYDSLENEVKANFAEDIFSIFIGLTQNLKTNLNFLLKFIEIIREKSFRESVNVYINNIVKLKDKRKKDKEEIKEENMLEKFNEIAEIKAKRFFEYLDLNNKLSFKLLNPLIKFFIKDCGIEKNHIFITTIKVLYDEKYVDFLWKSLNLKKIDNKPEFYLLPILNYNILHEIIRIKNLSLFQHTNILSLKEFLFKGDNTNTSPFHLLFKNGSYEILTHIIQESHKNNILQENLIDLKTNKEKNIIHFLIENKNLNENQRNNILHILKNAINLEKLLCSNEKFNFLPLSYYICENLKKIDIDTILLLCPGIFSIKNKYEYFIYINLYGLLKNTKKIESKNRNKDFEHLTIFNNKIIEMILNINNENMFILLINKLPFLDFNIFINDYDGDLYKENHVLDYLIQRNWIKALNFFFEKYFEKNQFCYFYQNSHIFNNLIEKNIDFKIYLQSFFDNWGFNIIEILFKNIKKIKHENFYSKMLVFLAEKIQFILEKFNEKEREKLILMVNFKIKQRKIDWKINNSILLVDIFESDENILINLFETELKSLKKLECNLEFKLNLLAILIKNNMYSFFEISSLYNLIKIDENSDSDKLLKINEKYIFLKQIYYYLWKNSECIVPLFNAIPYLFVILFQNKILEKYNFIPRKIDLNKDQPSLEKFLGFCLNKYNNSEFDENIQKDMYKLITYSNYLFLTTKYTILDNFYLFNINYVKKLEKPDIIILISRLKNYIFFKTNNEKEIQAFYNILTYFFSTYKILETPEIPKLMKIKINRFDSQISIQKLIDFLKKGFDIRFLKISKKNILFFRTNMPQTFYKYFEKYLDKKQSFLEFLISDREIESNNIMLLSEIILFQFGKWQIFLLLNNKKNCLEIAFENCCFKIVDFLLQIKEFKDYDFLMQILNNKNDSYNKLIENYDINNLKNVFFNKLISSLFVNLYKKYNNGIIVYEYGIPNKKQRRNSINIKNNNIIYPIEDLNNGFSFIFNYFEEFINKSNVDNDVNYHYIFAFFNICHELIFENFIKIPFYVFEFIIQDEKSELINNLFIKIIQKKDLEKINYFKSEIFGKIFENSSLKKLYFKHARFIYWLIIIMSEDLEFGIEILSKFESNFNIIIETVINNFIRSKKYVKIDKLLDYCIEKDIKINIKTYNNKFNIDLQYSIATYINQTNNFFTLYSSDKIFEEFIKKKHEFLENLYKNNCSKFLQLNFFSDLSSNSLSNKMMFIIQIIKNNLNNEIIPEIFKNFYLLGLFLYHFQKNTIYGITHCKNKNDSKFLLNDFLKNFTFFDDEIFKKKYKIAKSDLIFETNCMYENIDSKKQVVKKKEIKIDQSEIDLLVMNSRIYSKKNNNVIKNAKIIEKCYIDRKRKEYFEENSSNLLFEKDKKIHFSLISFENFEKNEYFGEQDPIKFYNELSLILDEYLEKNNFEEIKADLLKLILFYAPLNYNLIEKYIALLIKKGYNKSELTYLGLEILYLRAKYYQFLIKKNNFYDLVHYYRLKNMRESIKIINILILEPENLNSEQEIRFKKTINIINVYLLQIYYDLGFYQETYHLYNALFFDKMSINILKSFIKFTIIKDDYEYFQLYASKIDRLDSIYSLIFIDYEPETEDPEEDSLNMPNSIYININNRLAIRSEIDNSIHSLIFQIKKSKYLLDLIILYNFNFEESITLNSGKNPKYKKFLNSNKSILPLFDYIIIKQNSMVFNELIDKVLQESTLENNDLLFIILEFGNIDFFKKASAFFLHNDQSKIFDFLINNEILMVLSEKGSENFLIDIMNEYIIPYGNKKTISEHKLIHTFIKKDLNIRNVNIFHLMAMNNMTNFLFVFLEYLLKFKFDWDFKKMRFFLEEMFLAKCELDNGKKIIYKTIIDFALEKKIYEIFVICDICDIHINKIDKNSEVQLDREFLLKSISYFSKYMVCDIEKILSKFSTFDKNNIFFNKFKDNLILFDKLKGFLTIPTIRKKEKIKKLKYVRNKNLIKKINKKKKKPEFPKGCSIIEGIIFGRRIISDLQGNLLDEIIKEIIFNYDLVIGYLFLTILVNELKEFDISKFLKIENEVFLFFLFENFNYYNKKNKEIATSLEISKNLAKIELKKVTKFNFYDILLNDDINQMLKNFNTKIKQDQLKGIIDIKLGDGKNNFFELSELCFNKNYKYFICFLMNYHSSDFLFKNERLNKSFFNEYLINEPLLCFRLFKIYEKSPIFNLLEQEFSLFVNNFMNNIEKKENTLSDSQIINIIKVFLLILIEDDGYFNITIIQIFNLKGIDIIEYLIKILYKLTNDYLSMKGIVDNFINEINNNKYEEILHYKFFKSEINEEKIIKINEKIMNILLIEFELLYKNIRFNKNYVNYLNDYVIESQIYKKNDYKCQGLCLLHIISLICSFFDGYGIFYELNENFNKLNFTINFERINKKTYNTDLSQSNDNNIEITIDYNIICKNKFILNIDNDSWLELIENLNNKYIIETNADKFKLFIGNICKNKIFKFFKKDENKFFNIKNLEFDLNNLKSKSLNIKKKIIYEISTKNNNLKSVPIDKNILTNTFSFINSLSIINELFNIDKTQKLYQIGDLFSPHNTQNITQNNAQNQNYNISQRIETEISYVLEQQPDNTYQIKYKMSENKKNFGVFDGIVFSEYYHLINLGVENQNINFVFIDKNEFIERKKFENSFKTIFSIIINYEKLFFNEVKNKKNEISFDLDWYYSIDEPKNQILTNIELFPPYVILKMRQIMRDFQNNIFFRGNLKRKKEFEGGFKINILTFIDVILYHILNSYKNTENKEKINGFFEFSGFDFYNIVNYFLDNSILEKNLINILREIYEKGTNLLKIIRGIYIQFVQKKKEDFCINDNVEDKYLNGFDKLFRFTNTTYFVNKYMLIIEIGVIYMYDSFDLIEKIDCFDEKREGILNKYSLITSNKYDFYESIFNSESIINFILNRKELDNYISEISKKLCALTSKTITISLNYDSFLNIFKNIIYNIKTKINDHTIKIEKYEKIWYLIESIKNYFLTIPMNELKQETINPKNEEDFYILYKNMLNAFTEKKSLAEILMNNYRIYEINENLTKDLGKIETENFIRLLKLSEKQLNSLDNHIINANYLRLSFIIKIDKNYMINNSSLGDIYFVNMKNKRENSLQIIQITLKANGIIYYCDLTEENMKKTEELNHRANNRNHHYSVLDLDKLLSVFLILKKWPENPKFQSNSLIGLSDSKLNIFFMQSKNFYNMLTQIRTLPAEEFSHSNLPYLLFRSNNSIQNDLTVSNLIQYYPNIISYDFELHEELSNSNEDLLMIPGLSPSLSFMRAQSLMQSMNKGNNLKIIKMIIDIEKNSFKKEEIKEDLFPLSSRLDINSIYNYFICQFNEKIINLFKDCGCFKENQSIFKLKIEIDREIENKSEKYEVKIIQYLKIVIGEIYDFFDRYIQTGNSKDKNFKKWISIMNFEFINEINPLKYILACTLLKYLKQINLIFELNKKKETFQFDTINKQLTIYIKIDDNIDYYENHDELYKNIIFLIMRDEFLKISEIFSGPQTEKLPEIIYNNKNFKEPNSNLLSIYNHGLNKKIYNKIELVLDLQKFEKECEYYQEKLMVQLVLMEFYIYQIIYLISFYENINKKNKNIQYNIRINIDEFKEFHENYCKYEINEKNGNFDIFISIDKLSNDNHFPLDTQIIQEISKNNIFEENKNKFSISQNDFIKIIEKTKPYFEFKILYEIKNNLKNSKYKAFIINSSTLEIFNSSSTLVEINEIRLSFEKNPNVKSDTYFFILCSNHYLFYYEKIIIMRKENIIEPIFEYLFNNNKKQIINKSITFLNFLKNENKDRAFQIKLKKIDKNEIIYYNEIPKNIAKIIDKNRKRVILEKTAVRKNVVKKKTKKKHQISNYKFKKNKKLNDSSSVIKVYTRWLNSKTQIVNLIVSEASDLTLTKPNCNLISCIDPFEYCENELLYEFRNTNEIFLPHTLVSKSIIGSQILHIPNHEEKNRIKNKNIKKFDEISSNNFVSILQNSCFNEVLKNDPVETDLNIALEQEIEYWKVDKIEDLDKEEIKNCMGGNVISVMDEFVKKNELYSIAGEKRIEFLSFYDKNNVCVDPNNCKFKIIFVHELFRNIKIEGNLNYNNEEKKVEVLWLPYLKGIYRMYINDIFPYNMNKLIILSKEISIKNTIIEVPEISTLSFHDEITIKVQYKDELGNIIGDIEKLMYNLKGLEFKTKSETKLNLKISHTSKLDKYGNQTFKLMFIPLEDSNKEGQADFEIYLKETLIKSKAKQKLNLIKKEMTIKLEGLSFNKRLENFRRENRNIGYGNIDIDRVQFLDELLNLKEKIKSSITVKFKGEEGSDGGGLKREFFDIAGNYMKDSRFNFFIKPIQTINNYTIGNNLVKMKEGIKYMEIFGKIMASSLTNDCLLGISFTTPFLKIVFYKTELNFKDLIEEFDEITYKNYENILNFNHEELDSLELNFVAINKGIEVELIENGSNIKVNTENREDYLNKIANFYIYQSKKEYYEAFKKGFNEAYPIENLTKWIRINELSYLTMGAKTLSPENLLAVTAFHGGNSILQEFFKTYVNESNYETLELLLKFITGSKSLPYNTTGFAISINFIKTNINNLPIGHSCFRSIEIPCYTSYSMLKKKLDIAFLFGAEGYGFA